MKQSTTIEYDEDEGREIEGKTKSEGSHRKACLGENLAFKCVHHLHK